MTRFNKKSGWIQARGSDFSFHSRMTRHSKNSSSSAYFTDHERKKLPYGTQSIRNTSESLRHHLTCHVCIEFVKEGVKAVVCEEGHLACHECILESMLKQKAAIKAAAKAYNLALRKIDEQKIQKDHQIKRAKLEQLESIISKNDMLNSSTIKTEQYDKSIKEPERRVLCNASMPPHPLTLKKLYPIIFTFKEGEPACPSCLKGLCSVPNSIACIPCGHVFCSNCAKECTQCMVCGWKAEETIMITGEGTGKAASNANVISTRYEPAFI